MKIFGEISIPALLLAFLCGPGAIHSQGQSQAQTQSQGAGLPTAFSTAVERDFEIVRDEFNTRSDASGGGRYWLVHVKPRHSGNFQIKYRYRYHAWLSDPLYSHVEREFPMRVGERGCRRAPQGLGDYAKSCVGDTIILPVAIDNFTEHEFSLTSSRWTKQDEETFADRYPETRDQGLRRADVRNLVADNLKYVGSGSHKMLHRAGGYTLEFYAVFEALRPGRFNLILGAPFAGVSLQQDASTGIPIIIVARETHLTLLASRENVLGYRMGYDGREYVSSTSGHGYLTNVLILQPGDRISLKYHTIVRSRASEFGGRDAVDVIALPPVIRKLPFAVDPRWSYNEWIMNYLPGN